MTQNQDDISPVTAPAPGTDGTQPVVDEPISFVENTESGMDSWFASLASAAVPVPGSSVEGLREPRELPPIDRVRPERASLVNRRLVLVSGAAVACILVALLAVIVYTRSTTLPVVDVAGLTVTQATDALEKVGFDVEVVEQRFSQRPINEVLEQSPRSGVEARKGSTVMLVISGGTDEFEVPDLVGQTLTSTRSSLEGKGLVVEVESVVSDQASGTVLGTIPSPGTVVRTGDSIRIQVAAAASATRSVKPYRLSGVRIVIDPEPPGELTTDPSMDVARRLSALFEASGAVVTMLRSGVDTSTSDSVRARRALASSATVSIGFSIRDDGPFGRQVYYYSGMGAALSGDAAGKILASSITSELAVAASPASLTPSAQDPVLAGSGVPWARISLGSAVQRTDLNAFIDPHWADGVARAVYMAVGARFGSAAAD